MRLSSKSTPPTPQQALLSILLNAPPELDIGETLREFKTFTSQFPPDVSQSSLVSSSDLSTYTLQSSSITDQSMCARISIVERLSYQ